MLNRHNLEIAKLVCKDQTRYTINAIKVTSQETIVTDGHLIMRVTTPKTEEPNQFNDFLLGQKEALTIAAAIPRKRSVKVKGTHRGRGKVTVIPQVANVGAETETDILISVPSPEMNQTFTPKKRTGAYPEVNRILANDKPQFEVILNPDILIPLLRQIQSASGKNIYSKGIMLTFYGDDKPVRIDAENADTQQRIMAIIMPMRGGVTRNYPLVDKPQSDADKGEAAAQTSEKEDNANAV